MVLIESQLYNKLDYVYFDRILNNVLKWKSTSDNKFSITVKI